MFLQIEAGFRRCLSVPNAEKLIQFQILTWQTQPETLGQRATSHGSGANSTDHNIRGVPLSEKLNSNVWNLYSPKPNYCRPALTIFKSQKKDEHVFRLYGVIYAHVQISLLYSWLDVSIYFKLHLINLIK